MGAAGGRAEIPSVPLFERGALNPSLEKRAKGRFAVTLSGNFFSDLLGQDTSGTVESHC
jgi:hypothetical protein